MKANSWLYHYYMVQSRLQYSLAYGGQSPTALAAFYPQSAFGGHQNFDGSSVLHSHSAASAFLPQNASIPTHHTHPHGYTPGYGYTPPPGAYNLQQDQVSQLYINASASVVLCRSFVDSLWPPLENQSVERRAQ